MGCEYGCGILLKKHRTGHNDCRCFFRHSSPAARAKELLKPFTDLGRFLVQLEKNFSALGLGFYVVDVTSGVFCSFLAEFTWPWAPTKRDIFWLKLVLQSRLSSASLEPLIGLSAYLESKLWFKNQNW